MPSDELTTAPNPEVDYISIAADLLRQMMSELKCLETNNSRLTLAMATAGHDLRQRLHGLLRTVDLLTAADDATAAAELSIKAKALIHRLAGELEQLVFQAGRDHRRPAPPKHCFDISLVLNQIELDWLDEAAAKRLHFEVVPTEAIVESERSLLSVIMNNIVGNAVRYTACGGVPWLSSMIHVHAATRRPPVRERGSESAHMESARSPLVAKSRVLPGNRSRAFHRCGWRRSS
jgi:signal transduction histidine kinase